METARDRYTSKPFAEALGELLRARPESGPLGRVSLRAFFAQVSGWQYEYLRQMVMGSRPLRPEAIEAMAAVLGVPPDYFLEYREWRVCEELRRHPEIVERVYDLVIAEAKALDERDATAPGGGQ